MPPIALLAPLSLVGLLTAQGDRQCKDGKESWINPRHEVDFTHVVHSAVPLEPLEGQVVLVTGEPATPPPSPPEGPDCPIMQMRSDWVMGKEGIRIRQGGGGPPGIRVQSATKVEVGARREKEELVVRFRNPLTRPLGNVSLQLHYEGCYGKPGSSTHEKAIGTLAPGAIAEHRFPVMDEPGGRHVAHSFGVEGGDETVTVAVDLSLAKLGVEVACPDR